MALRLLIAALLIYAWLALQACRQASRARDEPAAVASDTVQLHPLIVETNNKAAAYKNVDWTKWCELFSQAYDSLLTIDPDPAKLFKQSLLDSIIVYSAFYKDSNAKVFLREAYYNRGYDFDELSNYYRAKDDYEKLLQLSNTVPFKNFHQEFMTLNSLANTYNRLGDVQQSEHMRLRQIQKCIDARAYDKLATAYLNLGILYKDTDDPQAAIDILNKAIQLKSINDYSLAKLYSALSSVESTAANESALAHNRKALELFSGHKEEDDTLYWVAGTYETLARILHSKHDPAAESMFAAAIQKKIRYEGTERAREIGKTYLALAAFYAENNMPAKELFAIQKALYTVTMVDTSDVFSLPPEKSLYAENTIMEALDAKAAWLMRHALFGPDTQQYLQRAMHCIELAFMVERELMKHLSYDASKLRTLQESRGRSERAIACSFQLHRFTGDITWIHKAWQFAEKNKAIVLLHSLRENVGPGSLQQDTLYSEVKKLQQQLAAIEVRLYREMNNSKDTNAIRELADREKILDQHLLDAKIKLRQENDAYRFLLETEDSLDLVVAAEKLLPPGTALIEYFAGDSTSYVFFMTHKQPPQLRWLTDSASAHIDSFLYYFSDKNHIINNPIPYQQIAHALYRDIIPSLDSAGDTHTLIIIPDGKLNVLPFDALLTKPSTSKNLKALPYLLHRYQLGFGYSILTLLKQGSAMGGGDNVLAFAPVNFSGKSGLANLPHTYHELKTILQEHPNTQVFTYAKAGIDAFRNQSHDAGILHIASHAGAGMQDSIAEGKPFIEFADSTLYLDELYNMHFHAGLVVLSACESGTGKIEKGEGAMSLARGFYYAGAGNIINSLWKVNDQSTAQLFGYFYKDIGERSYAKALHEAKLSYLQHEPSSERASPYYWAGFIIIGHNAEVNRAIKEVWLLTGVIAFSAILLVVLWQKIRMRG
ncbi:MAG TPA: CHAT domain-containing tetratricopeptide repeat protein [Chitinophagaceae bacterium]|nr:CHAT domain-containing tetratricopeptide repeat protein [Chitinophagaceae bacterium]